MGAAASITQDEASDFPQYQLLGGSSKFVELKDTDGKVSLDMVQDPYLLYGGNYENDPKDTAGFKFVNFSKMPNFTSDHNSAMANVLTQNLFDKLNTLKTSKDFTLSNVIQPGVINPSLEIGASIGDEECFEAFQELLYPMIRMVHNYDPATQQQIRDLDITKLDVSTEQTNMLNKFKPMFHLVGERSISGLSFPPGAKNDDRKKVEELFISFAESHLQGKYYSLETLSEDDKSKLLFKGISVDRPRPNDFITSAGGSRLWPKNRGVYLDNEDSLLVWINYENHVRFLTSGHDLTTALDRFADFLRKFESFLGSQGLQFAWHDSLGYLGCNLASIGIALKCKALVSLPHLSKHDIASDLAASLNVVIKNADDKFEVSSKNVMGVTEIQLMSKFVESLTKILDVESKLENGASIDEFKNQVTGSIKINPTLPMSPIVHMSGAKAGVSAAKIVVVASSPKNKVSSPKKVVVAPTSPKPAVSEKSKSSKSFDEADVMKTPISDATQSSAPKSASKPVTTTYMSCKYNRNLKINIDELKLPNDH